MAPTTAINPARSSLSLCGVLLVLLAFSLGAAANHARAQSVVSQVRADLVCGSSTASLSYQADHAGLAAPSDSLACRVATYVRELLLHDAIIGSGNILQSSVAMLIFASAYGGAVAVTGKRERWSALDRAPAPVDGVRGLGFTTGRARWAISKVSLSSVLLSLRLSV